MPISLTPPNIINLSYCHSQFSCLREPEFWKNYNLVNKNIIWNKEISSMEVAFSYFWFKNNEVQRAAIIGFPEAKKIIEQERRLKSTLYVLDKNTNYIDTTEWNPRVLGKFLGKYYGGE